MKNPFRPAEYYNTACIIITWSFAFIAIACVAALDHLYDDPYLIASFGATAVLIYGAPKAAFSQPKNVFFGHLFSAVIGISIALVFEQAGLLQEYVWTAAGIAVSTAIIAMMLTGTIHPPGGATALTCVISGFTSFIYVVRPVMLGVVILMIAAYCADYLKERFSGTDQNA